ncbi:3-(3-hydroxy-phenyl)propionate/3-hydroxycinnamic acid hydroxylase [Baekduia alba]|uniref:FAD-dependent oxidoreductase n=1 Tax=Baekduia alba TaxID=2997333 RepID=UPI0023415922|nr:NAD(P)/FAD-dependent oxidoreductase [Baekduia alba]WCB96625.1 3-(3-hydroxy-phenyl)propionate/3-hydroxycinnamic acid hydroxylase [Baekduia alba]
MPDTTDVVIAGGSVAGCALAVLLGRQGVRVTVLEKSPKPEHYKVVCTHFIQAGATPVLRRLGIAETMERAGAVRNGLEVFTPGGGWYVMPDDEHGYSLRREKLDPMLRELAARTPDVQVRQGVTVTDLVRDDAGRPAGLRGRTAAGDAVAVDARVIVGADGRGSTIAALAGVPGRVLPHNRFGYMAYYADLELEAGGTRAPMWLVGRDVFYCFPNDDGLTVAAVFLHKDRLPEFKRDKEAAFVAAFDGLDRGPDLRSATRVSPLIGKLDVPNVRRPAARPGVAFVGDAAQASDPVWGVGVGFALQSAEWLADELAGAFCAGVDPDPALERYRRTHRRRLALHHLQMADFATGRELNPLERTMHRAAARDPRTAKVMAKVAARSEPLERALRPRDVARAAVVAMAR